MAANLTDKGKQTAIKDMSISTAYEIFLAGNVSFMCSMLDLLRL